MFFSFTEVVHPLVLQRVTEGDIGPTGLEQVAAGGMHTLVLDSNSKIWSFESNDSLALGRPTTPPEGNLDDLPELVVGREDSRAAAIAASDNLSIALSKKGELRAWGTFNTSDGLLGFVGHEDKVMTPTAFPAFHSKPIARIACGENHARLTGTHTSFAINKDGAVFAWSLNQMRQTGVTSVETHIQKVPEVTALHPDEHEDARIVEIASGKHHTHFLFDNGRVWCGCSGPDRLGLAADHPRVLEHVVKVDAADADSDFSLECPRRDDFLVDEPMRIAFPPLPTPANREPALPYTAGFSATHIRWTLGVDESEFRYSWSEGNTSQLGLGKTYQVATASAGGQYGLLL
ncbi:RCC1/BLIP-II [Mycena olivaceomarginata]|nr:RCC1/BLIP-II [Mycena olivaceomarginata]